jgi:Cu+-exporting ATPase
VLIVACPCSLLLSATFTYGNMLRIFGKNKLYLKNSTVIESMAGVDTIVFDKTGTITQSNLSVLKYSGQELSEEEKAILKNLSSHSSHPLSKVIAAHLQSESKEEPSIQSFQEFAGKGISAVVNDVAVRMGSAHFIGETSPELISYDTGTHVHVQIGNELKGKFSISNHYRKGIRKEIASLKGGAYELHVLSGDNDTEKENLQYIFDDKTALEFRQTPAEKLAYIKQLQSANKRVMMIGDGLNDSGALMQADVGIAVNDNTAQFTPACDAILDGAHISDISKLLRYAKAGKKIVTASFILSILYNIVGLSFAVSASLSPIVAAILMPASSISIVLFVTLASNLTAKKLGL